MSKKTNANKQLAKRKAHAPKNKRKGRVNTFTAPFVVPQGIIPSPFSLFPSFGGLISLLIGPPPMPREIWVCDPCGLNVAPLHPGAGPLNYCPSCRGPLRLIGHGETPNSSSFMGSIVDAEFEDVTHKRLPAPEEKE